MNETLIFLKILLLTFNTFIPVNLPLIEEPLNFLFWHRVKLYHCFLMTSMSSNLDLDINFQKNRLNQGLINKEGTLLFFLRLTDISLFFLSSTQAVPSKANEVQNWGRELFTVCFQSLSNSICLISVSFHLLGPTVNITLRQTLTRPPTNLNFILVFISSHFLGLTNSVLTTSCNVRTRLVSPFNLISFLFLCNLIAWSGRYRGLPQKPVVNSTLNSWAKFCQSFWSVSEFRTSIFSFTIKKHCKKIPFITMTSKGRHFVFRISLFFQQPNLKFFFQNNYKFRLVLNNSGIRQVLLIDVSK